MDYSALPGLPLADDAVLAKAAPTISLNEVLEQPAISMMTDLTKTQAVTIEPDARIDEVKAVMLRHGVRMLFVEDNQSIVGLITSTDILGEKPLQTALKSRVKLTEILVRDLMTPQDRLEVMDMKDVARAKVGHLVATMKQSGRQHALTVCHNSDNHTEIRGIFSAADLSRRLGIEFNSIEIARSFAEIEDRLIRR